jgi:hypothetical protein
MVAVGVRLAPGSQGKFAVMATREFTSRESNAANAGLIPRMTSAEEEQDAQGAVGGYAADEEQRPLGGYAVLIGTATHKASRLIAKDK